MRRFAFVAALAALCLATACQRQVLTAATPAEFRAAVAGAEWQLVRLGAEAAPVGAGARRATIRFEADSARAGGFAGCNRWSASYTLDGDAIRFGPVVMTRMACAEGMQLEQRLAAALDATRRFEIRDDELRLLADSGTVATFSR